MKKSGRVSLSDLRRSYRLLDDCRDAGSDPATWPGVLAPRLARLVDAQVCAAGEVRFAGDDQTPRSIFLVNHGWQSEDDGVRYRQISLDGTDREMSVSFDRESSAT
jgi:hypothetical protein